MTRSSCLNWRMSRSLKIGCSVQRVDHDFQQNDGIDFGRAFALPAPLGRQAGIARDAAGIEECIVNGVPLSSRSGSRI